MPYLALLTVISTFVVVGAYALPMTEVRTSMWVETIATDYVNGPLVDTPLMDSHISPAVVTDFSGIAPLDIGHANAQEGVPTDPGIVHQQTLLKRNKWNSLISNTGTLFKSLIKTYANGTIAPVTSSPPPQRQHISAPPSSDQSCHFTPRGENPMKDNNQATQIPQLTFPETIPSEEIVGQKQQDSSDSIRTPVSNSLISEPISISKTIITPDYTIAHQPEYKVALIQSDPNSNVSLDPEIQYIDIPMPKIQLFGRPHKE
jgi:hypothetical protein